MARLRDGAKVKVIILVIAQSVSAQCQEGVMPEQTKLTGINRTWNLDRSVGTTASRPPHRQEGPPGRAAGPGSIQAAQAALSRRLRVL